jgi:leader peptidase (prepilin peptidase)/N-methyltransferase
MRALDLSANLLLVLGALTGLAGGTLAASLCDRLPARYEIAHVVTGSPRTRRNVGLVVIAGAVGLWLAHLVAGAPNTSLERAAFYFTTNLVVAVALLAAAAVDLEHMILPNELTLAAGTVALATAPWRAVGLVGALAGAAVGLALTYLPFLLYKKVRGRSGMGLGDAKLAIVAGVWLGAPGVIFVVFAAAVQSTLCAAIMRVLGVELAVPASVTAEIAELRAKAEAGDLDARAALADDPMAADVGDAGGRGNRGVSLGMMRLPLGPFLVLACLEFLVARSPILAVFDRLVSPP